MARIGVGDSRAFAAAYLQSMDAEYAAKCAGLSDGAAILSNEEVEHQIARRRATLKRQLLPEDVVRMLAALAFGRCNDCVKLVLESEPAIDSLNLMQLAEIKRNEKGTVELKLVDRLAAIEQLSALVAADEDSAADFLRALGAASETP